MLLNHGEHYHPFFVHLPIALTVVWVVMEMVTFSYQKRRREYDLVFVVFALLGVIGSFLANLTGDIALNLYQQKMPQALSFIEAHAEIAVYILWFYLLLTIITTIILVVPVQWLRILRFGLACGLTIIVWIAAAKGASLVFEHGVGVWQTPLTK